MQHVFITGTDTEVGKTIISAGLIQGLADKGFKSIGMKPIASGSEKTDQGLRNADALALMAASNVQTDYDQINPYCFAPPVSPHFAAAKSGREIDLSVISARAKSVGKTCDRLVIEGVGGWYVPLNNACPAIRVADLALLLDQQWDTPLGVVMVVGLRLGCINHALLTAEAIQASGLKVIGLVATQIDPNYQNVQETLETLDNALNIPRDFVPYLDKPDANTVASYLTTTIKTLQ